MQHLLLSYVLCHILGFAKKPKKMK